jgi:hypothetical protein
MKALAELLEEERQLAIQLKNIKDREMELRVKIADRLGKGLDPGTHNFIRDGFRVKLKLGLNYSLDQSAVHELIAEELLSDEELDAIRTKYELKLTDYKSLDNSETLDDAIIVKPAAPTLIIELGE